jgi:hypothetical protein
MKWISFGNCRVDSGESGGITHRSASPKVRNEKNNLSIGQTYTEAKRG